MFCDSTLVLTMHEVTDVCAVHKVPNLTGGGFSLNQARRDQGTTLRAGSTQGRPVVP